MKRTIIAAAAAAVLASFGLAGQASAQTYGPFESSEECVEAYDWVQTNPDGGGSGESQPSEEEFDSLGDGNKELAPNGYTEYWSEEPDSMVTVCYLGDDGYWYFTV
ncbi:hypothetical protein HLB23_14190 [Nocardia uniformis]|uniref:Secreted protein n=1 Tax=Nocardia uniformis TaxID=53432 RepID=A0A849C7Z2_9NOCA|nr:hypothetical protein [Nocardia uniformis]NNH70999.1 hypothetical protein [Nocardia uniformis]